MNELRVALIVLGAVFLAVLLLWERRRSARRVRPAPLPENPQPLVAPAVASSSRHRRLEPHIGDFSPGATELPESLEVPTIHPVESLRVEVKREVAVDVPGVTPLIRWPPAQTERVLTVRVVRADGQGLAGRALRQAMESGGMVHGPQRIYHLVDAEGVVRASAANLVRPGSFDPSQMDAQEFRGLSLFSILPGPVASLRMLEDLLDLAQRIAVRVDAVVQDEQGAQLAGERLAQLRRSLQPPVEGPPA